jgi:hypothetical protein
VVPAKRSHVRGLGHSPRRAEKQLATLCSRWELSVLGKLGVHGTLTCCRRFSASGRCCVSFLVKATRYSHHINIRGGCYHPARSDNVSNQRL